MSGHARRLATRADPMTAPVHYRVEPDLSVDAFRAVLVASGLAARRPIDEVSRLARMLAQADLIVTARAEGRLVGVARAVTDFAYCCYLSDLAVAEPFQRQGIGRRLITETHAAAGDETTLVLVAAPGADDAYRWMGLQTFAGCWGVRRKR